MPFVSFNWRLYKKKKKNYKKKSTSMGRHFLARLGACNLILHIHVVVNRQLSRQGIADQFHMIASQAQVSTHRGCVFFFTLSPDKLLVFI